jgi:nicotinamide riboside kinase
MKKVGFAGVPGAGKSTLARAISAGCRDALGFDKIELVSEYARRYISKYGSIDSIMEQYRILEKQYNWENSIINNDIDLMLTDSPIHMGFLYAMEMRDVNSLKDTIYINDIFKRMNKLNCPPRYDIIFHLPPLWKPSEDGIRSQQHFEDGWRTEADLKIQFIFRLFPPKHFITLKSETMRERIVECFKYCKEFL